MGMMTDLAMLGRAEPMPKHNYLLPLLSLSPSASLFLIVSAPFWHFVKDSLTNGFIVYCKFFAASAPFAIA
jgi:hypothetical protein